MNTKNTPIVKMLFGSKLYGTDTVNSDTDYKGIFLPEMDEVLMGNVVKSENRSTGDDKSKNSADDVDFELYSLQHFLKMALKGEMIVFDMLHAPKEAILESSPIWDYIQQNKKKFYSKNLTGYIGYIKRQLNTYGDRAKRLKNLQELITTLYRLPSEDKLTKHWDELIINEFNEKESDDKMHYYIVAGKKFAENVTVQYLLDNVTQRANKYGSRVEAAGESNFVDYKALSHAFRSVYQLIEIYETGDLKFPLRDADYIKKVKTCEYDFVDDKLGEKLEELLEKVRKLAENSEFPEEVDPKFAKDLIHYIYLGIGLE